MTRGNPKTRGQTHPAQDVEAESVTRPGTRLARNSAEGESTSRCSGAVANLRFDEGPRTPAFEFEEWDGGRMCVNRQFARVLEGNRLTTFQAMIELAAGDVVRAVDCRSTVRIVLSCAGKDYAFYLKRHRPSRLVDRLRPVMHLSRPILGARHEWEALLQFHTAGIPTMTPVAFGEFESHSFVMTLDLAAERTLLDWVNATADEERSGSPNTPSECLSLKRGIIRHVASIARRMHDAGLHHQDFYLNHLLSCGNPSALDIRVIDLGRVRKHVRLSQRWIIKDLAQLDFSARRLSCHDRLRFLRLYLGRPFRPADRWLIRQVMLKSWYIAGHTAKNNL